MLTEQTELVETTPATTTAAPADAAADATTGPVRWSTDLGAYVVTDYDLATAVLRSSEGWSSDLRKLPNASQAMRQLPQGSMLFMDAPDHTRLRRLISPSFTPRAIESLRPRVAAIVDAVLDRLGEDGGPDVDVVAEVGRLVPLALMAELMDVGEEGAELLRRTTPVLFQALELDPTPEDALASAAAATELVLFLTPLIAERREKPGDDFISSLLTVEGIELEEVLATCVLLLLAGHETTANLIGNGALAVLSEPERREQFLADPRRAVEELLRLEGPARQVIRIATTDHELAGVRIPAGQVLFVDIRQANRDPERFADPERLDLTREPVQNLALGGGAHFCLGAGLSRLEVTEALTRLFTRFPNMALTSDSDHPIRWRRSTTFYALEELHVTLD